jgi:septal ring factor EnvC (AmiA/AmiB activator)
VKLIFFFFLFIYHNLNDFRKSVEKKRKEVEAKEQKMAELNQQLAKRKEQMDQLEKSLQKAGGSAAATTELSKKLADTQMQLEK